MITIRTIFFLLLLIVAGAGDASADVAGGEAPGNPVSTVDGFLTETAILQAMGQGAAKECFLASINIGQVDTCTYQVAAVPVPMVCIRIDMNSPMAFVEASDRQGDLSLYSDALAQHMSQLNAGMSPSEKTMVQQGGDGVSCSASTQGHCINMFLAAASIKQIINAVSLETLCSPAYEYTRIPYGYAFASEADHMNGTEYGNWRGIISNYWFIPWLTPFTAISRVIETPGLCPIDWYKLFCHGGWGTVYPAAGSNPAESQTMNLSDSAYDSVNPTYGFFMEYGPLHLRMGSTLVDFAHADKSFLLGASALNAQLTRGGYIQPLFPTNQGDCLDTANVGNDVNPAMEVWAAQLTTKPIAETNSNQITDNPRYSDHHRNIAACLWPRFTCCNWCAGSDEAPARHFSVGQGFWPQLIDSTQ